MTDDVKAWHEENFRRWKGDTRLYGLDTPIRSDATVKEAYDWAQEALVLAEIEADRAKQVVTLARQIVTAHPTTEPQLAVKIAKEFVDYEVSFMTPYTEQVQVSFKAKEVAESYLIKAFKK